MTAIQRLSPKPSGGGSRNEKIDYLILSFLYVFRIVSSLSNLSYQNINQASKHSALMDQSLPIVLTQSFPSSNRLLDP
jgi:hypothetical protein